MLKNFVSGRQGRLKYKFVGSTLGKNFKVDEAAPTAHRSDTEAQEAKK